ncbi:M16 family metallopeptidase [Cyanobium sp. HWJ4-Hawea]|uniref:M16 family metallopeptidase n=1 Tax=Cyanobium sp. HWJ4-Hawea TaxID=2823713 RepID=UPI0020CBD44D|nr:pitrilysin family protein [Cyanobium sp. HWJ4-Hawea]
MSTAEAITLLPGLNQPHEWVLGNGARVVSLSMESAPLVCIDFWCRAGSAFEGPGESGMAHFLEHMVFKGSRTLAAGEFDRRIEALGGQSNAATGFDDVHFHLLIPPVAAAEALELLMELVLEPRLDQEAFNMERQVVLEELAQSQDQPDEVALQTLLSMGCPNHPYGEAILGKREALLGHTPAAMGAFGQRLYGANRCVLAMAGQLEGLELEQHLNSSALARLKVVDGPPPGQMLEVAAGQHRISLPRLESARLLMLWPMPKASELEAVMGADILTTVLAEGRRSRLVDRLREQLRIVESIDLELHALESGSFALLEAVCDVEDLPAVRDAIGQVWQELMEQPLGESEWQRAQRLVANGYRFGLEAPGGVAGLIGSNALWGRPPALETPLALLERWSAERLHNQMLPCLDPQRAFVLEALPA